jgi:hypothetical protein
MVPCYLSSTDDVLPREIARSPELDWVPTPKVTFLNYVFHLWAHQGIWASNGSRVENHPLDDDICVVQAGVLEQCACSGTQPLSACWRRGSKGRRVCAYMQRREVFAVLCQLVGIRAVKRYGVFKCAGVRRQACLFFKAWRLPAKFRPPVLLLCQFASHV